MKTAVYNQNAEVIGEIELNPKVFEVKPNEHLLAEAVRIQLSNARQGTAHTKTRGEVRGGGKKPWKQKGTGRARAGSIRSPIWRHGGVAFGPRSNRNWELKINKTAKKQALLMSLSDKAKHGKIIVVDSITLAQAKTKEFLKVISGFQKSLNTNFKKCLVMVPKNEKEILRASKNLQDFNYLSAQSLNVVDIIKAQNIIALKDCLPVIEKIYLKSDKKK